MVISQKTHYDFMQQALQLASQRRGFCAPNPAVGAIVVKDGHIIGEGAHWACGHPHAETAALESLEKAQTEGAVLYVTLEPCAHHGRTPPCTDLIIRSGIREIFYGMCDANPDVAGGGAAVLEKAGIRCHPLTSPEITQFYQSYEFWLKHQKPFITLKLAVTLDGKIAGEQGRTAQITGEECQRFTHEIRRDSDAILTTAASTIADDPQLNIRLTEDVYGKPLYILDSQLRLPLNARVFQTAESITIFHAASASAQKKERLIEKGAKCLSVESDEQGLNLSEILSIIGKEGRHDLLVEAGACCFQAFLQHHLAQRIYIYVAPKMLGPNATNAFLSAISFPGAETSWKTLGHDAVLRIDFSAE